MTDTKVLVAESCHWYKKDGTPCYEVPKAKGEGTRPTTLADARKLDLVPSVTTILGCAAKPRLEAWKAKQILEAALTLPKLPDETLDDYATRVVEDSKAQGLKARERGTELHAAIEDYIRGQTSLLYQKHCEKLETVLHQYGISLLGGKPEHSFSKNGYGGKIDYHCVAPAIIVDFKTTAQITPKTKPYDEHLMQCAAYGQGLFIPPFQAFNVFVGIDDLEVRVFEHSEKDLERGWKMFQCLLTYWKLSKNWTGEAQPK